MEDRHPSPPHPTPSPVGSDLIVQGQPQFVLYCAGRWWQQDPEFILIVLKWHHPGSRSCWNSASTRSRNSGLPCFLWPSGLLWCWKLRTLTRDWTWWQWKCCILTLGHQWTPPKGTTLRWTQISKELREEQGEYKEKKEDNPWNLWPGNAVFSKLWNKDEYICPAHCLVPVMKSRRHLWDWMSPFKRRVCNLLSGLHWSAHIGGSGSWVNSSALSLLYVQFSKIGSTVKR